MEHEYEIKKLAINRLERFYFGTATNPVNSSRGFIIGGDYVFSELNISLPAMSDFVESVLAGIDQTKLLRSQYV